MIIALPPLTVPLISIHRFAFPVAEDGRAGRVVLHGQETPFPRSLYHVGDRDRDRKNIVLA